MTGLSATLPDVPQVGEVITLRNGSEALTGRVEKGIRGPVTRFARLRVRMDDGSVRHPYLIEVL